MRRTRTSNQQEQQRSRSGKDSSYAEKHRVVAALDTRSVGSGSWGEEIDPPDEITASCLDPQKIAAGRVTEDRRRADQHVCRVVDLDFHDIGRIGNEIDGRAQPAFA